MENGSSVAGDFFIIVMYMKNEVKQDTDAQMRVEMRYENELHEFHVYEFAHEIGRNRIQLSW